MKDKIVRKHETHNQVDIFLSGIVGKDFFAKQITTQLEDAGPVDKINVLIDTPGGSYDEGIEIYMALTTSSAYVVTNIQGHGSSMGSIIFLSGDERNIAVNSWIMLHEVTGSAGIKEANARMVEIYRRNTELSKPDLIDIMACSSWLDAGAAIDGGFADFLTPPVPFENESSYLKHRTQQNHFASKYESFSGAKAKRKNQLLKNQMAYASDKAARIRDQRELCAQYNITPETFNLLMNQEETL